MPSLTRIAHKSVVKHLNVFSKTEEKTPRVPFQQLLDPPLYIYIYIMHREFTILELYDRLSWGMNFLQTYLSIIPQCFPFIRILIMPFNKRRNSRMVLHFFFHTIIISYSLSKGSIRYSWSHFSNILIKKISYINPSLLSVYLS